MNRSAKEIRIVYMGTPEFAVPPLQELVKEGYNVVGVITVPDKPSGRGQKVNKSAVKIAAEELGLTILQPSNLKDTVFQDQLKDLAPDLQIVVAFRMLPESVWSLPPMGTFNLHGSLLPKYRGAAPIHWAVINGEKKTGLTTFLLKHEIDTGDIIDQLEEEILDTDTTGSLYIRLMNKGAKMVINSVDLLCSDSLVLKPQTGDMCHAPKIFKQDAKIDWTKNTEEIDCFIRGMNPFPGAWTEVNETSFQIIEHKPLAEKHLDFSYDTDGKSFLHLRTKDGAIAVNTIKAQGKRAMPIEDYLRGNKI